MIGFEALVEIFASAIEFGIVPIVFVVQLPSPCLKWLLLFVAEPIRLNAWFTCVAAKLLARMRSVETFAVPLLEPDVLQPNRNQ